MRAAAGGSERSPAFVPQVTLALPPTVESAAPVISSNDGDVAVNVAADSDPEPVAEIYSSADAEVIPPELRQPQLPPPLLNIGGVLNTIELIVSATGTVERVKLLSPPTRMADMMLLSGAKTWIFAPASRLGHPVRYRLLLSWDATP